MTILLAGDISLRYIMSLLCLFI